jgi:hypothetical protein
MLTIAQIRLFLVLGAFRHDQPEGPACSRDAAVPIARTQRLVHHKPARGTSIYNTRVHRRLRAL